MWNLKRTYDVTIIVVTSDFVKTYFNKNNFKVLKFYNLTYFVILNNYPVTKMS